MRQLLATAMPSGATIPVAPLGKTEAIYDLLENGIISKITLTYAVGTSMTYELVDDYVAETENPVEITLTKKEDR